MIKMKDWLQTQPKCKKCEQDHTLYKHGLCWTCLYKKNENKKNKNNF